jgi:predicted membrane-bound spermidine synthase
VLGLVFGATGFSALCLQVVWQRVISLHAGVDLVSFTTIVAAFLAGLGLGNLVGGALADRLGVRWALIGFAAANVGIAVYAWASVALLYGLYQSLAERVASTAATFGFNFALLLGPTLLMGLSLPLVAKGVVERIEDAGPLVGRLYAVNTIGAALGAAVGGWFLIGTFGFTTTVRLAGSLNLAAAVAVFLLWRSVDRSGRWRATPEPHDTSEPIPADADADAAAGGRVWPWYVVYALTGAVALGFELVFFRLIDAVMRSNSYSFAHVLFLYLSLFGIGSALGSRFVRRVSDPARAFLTLQFAVGVSAVAGVVVLTRIAPALGAEELLRKYFSGGGFNTGFGAIEGEGWQDLAVLVFAWLVGPLTVMGMPVLLMGASFPFVQALVARRLDTLGRRTGTLLTANIAGNVAGTLIVGFVLLDRLGTVATVLVLAGALVVPGVAAAAPYTRPRPVLELSAGIGVFAVALAAMPSNRRLWAFLHGVEPNQLTLVEDRSCVNTTRPVRGQTLLFINASSQNGHPFDDFHVLIGLMPALLHPDPAESLVIGLGIGSTPWSVARDPRVERLTTVEICGGQIDLLGELAAGGITEIGELLADDRVDLRAGDGRDHLLRTDARYDLINVDTLRPQSAFSGSLYSTEFYQLVRDRLADDGLLSQWVPTTRTFNTVTSVFPHVVVFTVPTYGSPFFVASDSPIRFDRQRVLERFDRLVPEDVFSPEQRASIRTFLETTQPVCGANGGPEGQVPHHAVNHDLHPRDEYFLNNPTIVPGRTGC